MYFVALNLRFFSDTNPFLGLRLYEYNGYIRKGQSKNRALRQKEWEIKQFAYYHKTYTMLNVIKILRN
jgi:hypothetical protein